MKIGWIIFNQTCENIAIIKCFEFYLKRPYIVNKVMWWLKKDYKVGFGLLMVWFGLIFRERDSFWKKIM